ncbi:MAG: sulfatase-like hydrolase/transferase, partial [Lachnospiraceae bacterium]|nr:sulfatase-like hydrolase/transferase [Lachnospiraceae bacterium]
WAKDAILTKYIFKCLESTEGQDLVYAISVQGHGGYTPNTRYDRHIAIKSTSAERASSRVQLEYYANMLYEMDEFVGELVAAIDNFDEDTILVMYGDHLPSLEVQQSELDHRSVYQTDYIIYSNCGYKFGRKDLSADELSSYVFEKLGVKNGVINTFRQTHKDDPLFKEHLATIEYDMLYGDNLLFNGVGPYKKTDMIMGLDNISIFNIVPNGTKENSYLILGENFTNYSKVYINGDQHSTKFINHNMLSVTLDDPLEFNDEITVWQSHLTCTAPYRYNVIPFNYTPPEEPDEQ